MSLENCKCGARQGGGWTVWGSDHAEYYGHIRNADMILGQRELLNAVKQNSDLITLELQKHDTGSRIEIWRMGWKGQCKDRQRGPHIANCGGWEYGGSLHWSLYVCVPFKFFILKSVLVFFKCMVRPISRGTPDKRCWRLEVLWWQAREIADGCERCFGGPARSV